MTSENDASQIKDKCNLCGIECIVYDGVTGRFKIFPNPKIESVHVEEEIDKCPIIRRIRNNQ